MRPGAGEFEYIGIVDLLDMVHELRGERDSLRAQVEHLEKERNLALRRVDDLNGDLIRAMDKRNQLRDALERAEWAMREHDNMVHNGKSECNNEFPMTLDVVQAALASTRPNCTSEAESTIAAKVGGK